MGATFITAGAVSGAWWTGPYYGTEEGCLLVRVEGEKFDVKYMDYGWEVVSNE